MRPNLAGRDLRDYFWLARSRTESTLSDVKMIPPRVRAAFDKLLSDNKGETSIGATLAKGLDPTERQTLLSCLMEEAERHPDRPGAPSALHRLAVDQFEGAGAALIRISTILPASRLSPTVPQNIAEIGKTDLSLKISAAEALTNIAKQGTTKAGKSAARALETLTKA